MHLKLGSEEKLLIYDFFSPNLLVNLFSEVFFWNFAVFVETLDRCFKNVCELDIVYNFGKVRTFSVRTWF